MERPDDKKLKSSMTLFDAAAEPLDIFQRVLDKYYNGKKTFGRLRLLEQHDKEGKDCIYCR